MKEIQIIVGGYTSIFDVPEEDEESVESRIIILLCEKGKPVCLDKKVRLVIVRDGELVIV